MEKVKTVTYHPSAKEIAADEITYAAVREVGGALASVEHWEAARAAAEHMAAPGWAGFLHTGRRAKLEASSKMHAPRILGSDGYDLRIREVLARAAQDIAAILSEEAGEHLPEAKRELNRLVALHYG